MQTVDQIKLRNDAFIKDVLRASDGKRANCAPTEEGLRRVLYLAALSGWEVKKKEG